MAGFEETHPGARGIGSRSSKPNHGARSTPPWNHNRSLHDRSLTRLEAEG